MLESQDKNHNYNYYYSSPQQQNTPSSRWVNVHAKREYSVDEEVYDRPTTTTYGEEWSNILLLSVLPEADAVEWISSRSCFNFLILMNFIPQIPRRPFMVSLGAAECSSTAAFAPPTLSCSPIVIFVSGRSICQIELTAKCDQDAKSIWIRGDRKTTKKSLFGNSRRRIHIFSQLVANKSRIQTGYVLVEHSSENQYNN